MFVASAETALSIIIIRAEKNLKVCIFNSTAGQRFSTRIELTGYFSTDAT